MYLRKKNIAVRPSAEAVRENKKLLENVFYACFSYGASDFFDGHIFCSNQDIELVFFYGLAFGYISPCEGFYRVSSTFLFFIRPGKLRIPFMEIEGEYADTQA